MTIFYRLLNKLRPDEDKLNELVNNSVIGSFFNILARFTSFVAEKIAPNSSIIKNIDNIYFVVFALLIFAIPFTGTGTLGALAALLIILSVINALFTHKKFKFSAIHVGIFAYLATLILSVGFSSLFLPSLKGFAKMIIYIGAFFSFFEFFKKNPDKIFVGVVLTAISCCLELLFALKQMLFGVEALAGWQDTVGVNAEHLMSRVFGTLKPFNPNLFAAYLLATTPCIFAVALYSFIKGKLKISAIFGFFALLALIATIKTGCRGAYIGLFFGGLLFAGLTATALKNYFSQRKSIKKLFIIGAIVVVCGGILAILASPSVLHRLESIFTLRGDSSNSYRMNVYISSLKMFFDNFWIGIGTGNTTYRLIYGLYMITGFDALGAYNIYLEMAVESGIFAPLIFLWTIVLTFAKSLKRLFEQSMKFRLVTICALSSVCAMLFHGFFDTIWYRPQIQLIFWFYISILAVITMKGFEYGQK